MSFESRSVRALAAGLEDGSLSAVSLVRDSLDRIAASDLNAFIDVQPDASLAQARAADQRRASGRGITSGPRG